MSVRVRPYNFGQHDQRAPEGRCSGPPWGWLQPLRLPMKVLAVITDPPEVRRILLHLIKPGVAPPGLDASALS